MTGQGDTFESIKTMSVANSSQNQFYSIVNLQSNGVTEHEIEMQNVRPEYSSSLQSLRVHNMPQESTFDGQ